MAFLVMVFLIASKKEAVVVSGLETDGIYWPAKRPQMTLSFPINFCFRSRLWLLAWPRNMSPSDSQTSLFELDKRLWAALDRWWSILDAAVCKHVVHGLNFIKYVSDSFAQRQRTFDIEDEI